MMGSLWSPVICWTVDFEPYERGYIEKWLFPGCSSYLVSDEHFFGERPDLLVVAATDIEPSPVAKAAMERWPDVPVYLISDEALDASFKPYGRRRLVLRNYFSPSWGNDRTFSVPLGFNSDILRGNSKKSEKSLSWAFAGQVKGDRAEMLRSFEHIPKHQVVKTTSFGPSSGLSGSKLRLLYEQAYFVPCPWGNVSPDSFRVMEALESGAIPVVRTHLGLDYFRFIFGDHPFVSGSSWEEISIKVSEYVSNPEELAALERRVKLWYREFSHGIKVDVSSLLRNDSRNELLGEQFGYQRAARSNPLLRILFWLHLSGRAKKMKSFMRGVPDRLVMRLGLSHLVRRR